MKVKKMIKIDQLKLGTEIKLSTGEKVTVLAVSGEWVYHTSDVLNPAEGDLNYNSLDYILEDCELSIKPETRIWYWWRNGCNGEIRRGESQKDMDGRWHIMSDMPVVEVNDRGIVLREIPKEEGMQ